MMRYYSTIKRNEMLLHDTIRINLENFIQTHKATQITPLTGNVQNRQIYRNEKCVKWLPRDERTARRGEGLIRW